MKIKQKLKLNQDEYMQNLSSVYELVKDKYELDFEAGFNNDMTSRISDPDWVRLQNDYESGELTFSEFIEQFDKSFGINELSLTALKKDNHNTRLIMNYDVLIKQESE